MHQIPHFMKCTKFVLSESASNGFSSLQIQGNSDVILILLNKAIAFVTVTLKCIESFSTEEFVGMILIANEEKEKENKKRHLSNMFASLNAIGDAISAWYEPNQNMYLWC